MAAATLNLTVLEKRMLSAAEAASYCGMVPKHFKALCPVQPVSMGGRFVLWDKRDLDQWIDTEKAGFVDASHDAILGRLA
ncbi:MAG TPA: hypothetical protein VNQ78_07035 [Paracoccus sp. (in: a-proteobacteria)]|uniref:helix-turn-helix transcriptional regulator n=1 Tax=Paracoccus sp. TaxID=267 RepID=UPI002B9732FB|nr:hypothetical protein [Paracoccus sp. (in: a-proteobacteria)]HWL56420.1 hypothetical protein [Paracoccus sp. (in: a-proteobacteria)]